MSFIAFVAVCVLGIDFLIYALFQWTYADRRATLQRKIAAERHELAAADRKRPFLVTSSKPMALTQARLQRIRRRMGSSQVSAKQIA